LPALLVRLRPGPEAEAIGFRHAAPLDRMLLGHRSWAIGLAAVLGAAAVALLPGVSFDFDPLNLKDPHSESVSTIFDLMKDPSTTPYTAEILAPSLADAEAMAKRLDQLPEVAQTITAASYVPRDQEQKRAMIGDLSLLLGPTLTPPSTLPPPSDAQILAAITACRSALQKVAQVAGPDSPSARLEAALTRAIERGAAIIPALQRALLGGLVGELQKLAKLLEAEPVTIDALPADIRDSWIAPDGRARVEVFPRGDARDPAVLRRFVAAVRTIAPDATGTPVTIQESGKLISSAFIEAGAIATSAITVLLAVVLRRARDVAMVVIPLLLAAILTLAVMVLIGMQLNYANIIALPLLLGIGVAFDIYFVMNWRAGIDRHLQSSTARAVVFSAFTTMTAFGSLALSNDPGTSEMGKLLSISLACTLFCTLFVLPALLGPAQRSSGS
jgi:hopanoid biosynthesis associated RND transporter like protein HpnN